MPTPSEEPHSSSKTRIEDLKVINFLCTFKIEIERQNLDHEWIKDQWPYTNQDQYAKPKTQTSNNLKISKLKDMGVLCTFKIKIESQNLEYGYTKDQWPYPNQYQDAKPQSGTSSVLQSPKSGLKGHGCSLHLQNQDREPKFGTWVYQRPVTISKSRSRCQSPVRNSNVLQSSKWWLWGHGYSLHF